MISAIGGICLFAYEEAFEAPNLVGVLLVIGSAIGAALYKVKSTVKAFL